MIEETIFGELTPPVFGGARAVSLGDEAILVIQEGFHGMDVSLKGLTVRPGMFEAEEDRDFVTELLCGIEGLTAFEVKAVIRQAKCLFLPTPKQVVPQFGELIPSRHSAALDEFLRELTG